MHTLGTRLGEIPSRRSQVLETLEAAIIGGDMEPGVLYSAPELARQFGVSPTPVREAMLHLLHEGLVEVVPNKGFRVLAASDRELDEIVELRYLLEVPMVGKLARASVTPAALDELERLAQITVDTAHASDIPGHVRADIAFHLALLEQTGNHQLVEVIRTLRSRSRVFGLKSPKKADVLVSSSNEHLELITLISAGHAKEAQRLMHKHIGHVRSDWSAGDA